MTVKCCHNDEPLQFSQRCLTTKFIPIEHSSSKTMMAIRVIPINGCGQILKQSLCHSNACESS